MKRRCKDSLSGRTRRAEAAEMTCTHVLHEVVVLLIRPIFTATLSLFRAIVPFKIMFGSIAVRQGRQKRSKERSDAMEHLQRHTISGLRHICELLGAPEAEDDSHVAEMVCSGVRFRTSRTYSIPCTTQQCSWRMVKVDHASSRTGRRSLLSCLPLCVNFLSG